MLDAISTCAILALLHQDVEPANKLISQGQQKLTNVRTANKKVCGALLIHCSIWWRR